MVMVGFYRNHRMAVGGEGGKECRSWVVGLACTRRREFYESFEGPSALGMLWLCPCMVGPSKWMFHTVICDLYALMVVYK